MSRENVERARQVIGDLQALFDLFSEDIVWDTTQFGGAVPLDQEGVVTGKRAAIQVIRAWVSTWQDYRFEVEDIIDAGSSVVLLVHETGRGRESGVPMENRYYQVWTFAGSQIVSGAVYERKPEALEAVGLRES